MAEEDMPMCAAMSAPALRGKPDSYFICTRDQGHDGDHSACAGTGLVLASWPRSVAERYWSRTGVTP